MKTKQIVMALGTTLALMTGFVAPASAHPGRTDKAEVFNWDGSSTEKKSTTTLHRNNVSVKAELRSLPPGHAMTIWAVVFEQPDACDAADAVNPGTGDVIVPGAPGCGEDDIVRHFLGEDDIDLTITYAAGGVVGQAGKLKVQNQIGGADTVTGDGTVDNPLTAEIHFVVRSHGPDQPGDLDTTTIDGGCVGPDLPPGTIPVNVGDCSDIQFSIHRA